MAVARVGTPRSGAQAQPQNLPVVVHRGGPEPSGSPLRGPILPRFWQTCPRTLAGHKNMKGMQIMDGTANSTPALQAPVGSWLIQFYGLSCFLHPNSQFVQPKRHKVASTKMGHWSLFLCQPCSGTWWGRLRPGPALRRPLSPNHSYTPLIPKIGSLGAEGRGSFLEQNSACFGKPKGHLFDPFFRRLGMVVSSALKFACPLKPVSLYLGGGRVLTDL